MKGRISLAAGMLLMASGAHAAANIIIENADDPGQGFNSNATPVEGQGTLPGETLGEARLRVFSAAADYWASRLNSAATIVIQASFENQSYTCTENSFGATLGTAGPAYVNDGNYGPNGELSRVPDALADAIDGQQNFPGFEEIQAFFNQLLDNGCNGRYRWYYGIDGNAGNNIDFYSTVLHEIAHGLGFLTFTNSDGSYFGGIPDPWAFHLYDETLGKNWVNMTQQERAASYTNSDDADGTNSNLTWSGPNVSANLDPLSIGTHGNGRVRMFAPSVVQGGSSVSHWDESLFPNALMEPFADPGDPLILAGCLFKDIGWSVADGACPDGDQMAPSPELTFSSNKSTVNLGDSFTLSWQATNATSCISSGNWPGQERGTSGTETFTPSKVKQFSFTLTCTNGDGGNAPSVQKTVNVTVQQSVALPTLEFSSNKAVVNLGESFTLSWSATNAVSCLASGNWPSGERGSSGTQSYTPTKAKDFSFTLTCSNANNDTVQKTVNVSVQQSVAPPTLNFSSDKDVVNLGDSFTLSWSATNAVSCLASGNWPSGERGSSGTQSYTPNKVKNFSFTLTCSNANSDTVQKTVNVSVQQSVALPTLNFGSDKSTINLGESFTLSWSATNAVSCLASGNWPAQERGSNGTQTYTPNKVRSFSFTLTCSNANNDTVQKTVDVTVQQPLPAPTLNFSSDQTTIHLGQSFTLSWDASNANSCLASGNWPAQERGTSGTQTYTPSKAKQFSFTLTCSNANNDTVQKTVNVTVNP